MKFHPGDRATKFDVSDVDADLARRRDVVALVGEAEHATAVIRRGATVPAYNAAVDLREIFREIREVARS